MQAAAEMGILDFGNGMSAKARSKGNPHMRASDVGRLTPSA